MISTYLKNLIMDNVWNTSASASALPEHLYLGYSTTAPTVEGTSISEPGTNTGYTRVSIDGKLGAATNGVVKNSSIIETPITMADQGIATHFVIFDAQIGGNFLAGGKMEHSRNMEIDSNLIFKVGSITISLEDKVQVSE